MFNYGFWSLLNQPSIYLAELTCLMYNFIWNEKPEKICRTQMCNLYNEGGLKMIDLER